MPRCISRCRDLAARRPHVQWRVVRTDVHVSSVSVGTRAIVQATVQDGPHACDPDRCEFVSDSDPHVDTIHEAASTTRAAAGRGRGPGRARPARDAPPAGPGSISWLSHSTRASGACSRDQDLDVSSLSAAAVWDAYCSRTRHTSHTSILVDVVCHTSFSALRSDRRVPRTAVSSHDLGRVRRRLPMRTRTIIVLLRGLSWSSRSEWEEPLVLKEGTHISWRRRDAQPPVVAVLSTGWCITPYAQEKVIR